MDQGQEITLSSTSLCIYSQVKSDHKETWNGLKMIQHPLEVLKQHPAAAHHIVECKEYARAIETTNNVEQMIDNWSIWLVGLLNETLLHPLLSNSKT